MFCYTKHGRRLDNRRNSDNNCDNVHLLLQSPRHFEQPN